MGNNNSIENNSINTIFSQDLQLKYDSNKIFNKDEIVNVICDDNKMMLRYQKKILEIDYCQLSDYSLDSNNEEIHIKYSKHSLGFSNSSLIFKIKMGIGSEHINLLSILKYKSEQIQIRSKQSSMQIGSRQCLCCSL